MNKKPVIAALLLVTALGIFSRATEKDARRFINLPRPNTLAKLPFSQGVIVGDTLYVAGTIGLDAKTGKPPADPAEEARLAMDGIQSVLKEAGMSADDLVSVTVYCSDLSQYEKFNSVYRTYFKKDFPARAFVGAGSLLFGAKFEVQAIAVRR